MGGAKLLVNHPILSSTKMGIQIYCIIEHSKQGQKLTFKQLPRAEKFDITVVV